MQKIRSFVLVAAVVALVAGSVVASPGVVNVNTATAEQLQMLPNVGPALADRILEFRDANGDFRSPDELVAVRGIGEKTLQKMAPYIVVDGDTTCTAKIRLPRARGTDGATR